MAYDITAPISEGMTRTRRARPMAARAWSCSRALDAAPRRRGDLPSNQHWRPDAGGDIR
jgi:hypothetical protein